MFLQGRGKVAHCLVHGGHHPREPSPRPNKRDSVTRFSTFSRQPVLFELPTEDFDLDQKCVDRRKGNCWEVTLCISGRCKKILFIEDLVSPTYVGYKFRGVV